MPKTDYDERMDHLMSGRRVFDTGRASKLAKTVLMFLMEIFPHLIVYNEYFCWYKGSKLFFDFHIKEYKLLFECQGRQHYEYTAHFHSDKKGFTESKKRDNLKKEYCQENGFTLIEIRYDEKLETSDDLLKKINKALGDKNGT